ncbi:uncharacterized protein LOC130754469 [Actinidia eriantha]|uniref:uncharacterized protein LOC130754469 n=1 Tax=Actinidia eriantha TaxID=165200 RepID=UPI00258AB425|nr:uncharacterized protein LOC130754469 [Actinidia eriantha]
MDPPPLTSHSPTAVAVVAANITNQLSHPDSANSSPRSRPADTWDEPLPLVPGAKLRLMCSYGGHIIPRPHDKSLCYVGGDTRMVVVDRHFSLCDLSSRLSRTLLSGRQFAFKYQLPSEELDSLISVTTDEDLENMIEEYDRITSTSPSKTARLRLFLFPAKPETAASMGSLLNDAKSETWFVDALNGAGLLPRGLSDSAAIDCLLELDADTIVRTDSHADLETQKFLGSEKLVKHVQEVHLTMPDSPLMEKGSSFGSSSSSPSMSNLPPIKVRVEDGQMVGSDERFSHITVQNQDDGVVLFGAPPPLPTVTMAANNMSGGGASSAATVSDDERSDQAAPAGLRKPPLPLQPVQRKLVDAHNLPSPDSKLSGGFNLPSPDSVASDSSIASATVFQEPTHVATSESRAPTIPIDNKVTVPDPNSQIQMQQYYDSPYVLLPPQMQHQHQQFVQASKQSYIHQQQHQHHPATAQAPISSYYQTYAPPPQPQQQCHHHHEIEQQYPLYLYPVTQTQVTQPAYNLHMQSNLADSTVAASSRPPTPPPKTAATPTTPTLVHVNSNQFQQQYMGVPQMHHHPSQSIAANYGFEYPHQTHDHHVYYAQHPVAASMAPQYQTMTPASAALLSHTSAQLPADNTNQQMRTSPPL